jgi:hypothetical protein
MKWVINFASPINIFINFFFEHPYDPKKIQLSLSHFINFQSSPFLLASHHSTIGDFSIKIVGLMHVKDLTLRRNFPPSHSLAWQENIQNEIYVFLLLFITVSANIVCSCVRVMFNFNTAHI